MTKSITAFVAFVLLTACATTPSQENLTGTHGNSTLRRSDATHYRLLSDPKAARDIVWSLPPLSLHVKGQLTTAGFLPIGEVEGRGALCKETEAWVSLSDGQIHQNDDGTTPSGPYVKGCISRSGGFVPSSREIFNAS